ncbi:MAG: protein kinase [Cyanobacteria bacterium REEB67]|nr:protein kinase [Cyanobacteria bacterium REEB67]
MTEADQTKSYLFDLATRQIMTGVGASNPPANKPADLVGKTIDEKYLIQQLIGSGGMGQVYLAKHLLLNKEMALKTFNSEDLDSEAKMRFRREAQAIAKLSHANVVQVFDYGSTAEGMPFYTMEYLQGQSLGDRIREGGALPVEGCISIFSQVCSGLASAHKKGIIHRDMKPDNIFLSFVPGRGNEQLVKIVDFGIAALIQSTPENQKLTNAGMIFGSPLYMSPEQATGLPVTEQSDIYSSGCALFEALTGQPPFRGPNAFSTMLAHQNAPIPTLESVSGRTDFPTGLQNLLNAMLAKKPSERLKSIDEVAETLARIAGRRKNNQSSVSAGANFREHDAVIPEAEATTAIASRQRRASIIVGLGLLALAAAIIVAITLSDTHTDAGTGKKAIPESSFVSTSKAVESAMDKSVDESDLQTIKETELKGKLEAVKAQGEIRLGNRKLTDANIKQIAECKWLKKLILNNCDIDNASLERLVALDLTLVNMSESNLDDVGLNNILKLKDLKDLNVKSTGISSTGIKKIATMPKLTRLTLANTHVQDFDLKDFAYTKVDYLDIGDNPQLTTECFRNLGKLHIWLLRLSGTAFDDKGLAYLSEMNTLCRIDLSHTKITGDGLKNFCKGREKLEQMNLTGCLNVSANDLKSLNAAYPKVKFECQKL